MAYQKETAKQKFVDLRVDKKQSPKKPVKNAPAATSEESNQDTAKTTGKVDSMIKDENISDRPARNTRAATKKGFQQASTEPLDETPTASTTITTFKTNPDQHADMTVATAKEPTSVSVLNTPSEDKVPLASLKRRRAIEDKRTGNLDLPRPKSSKLDKGSSSRPFRKIRQLRMLEESDSEGWDTKDFNIEHCCIDTVDLCRIPSPFMDLGDQVDSIMRTIDIDLHPQMSFLFRCIYNHVSERIALLTDYLDKSDPGPFVAYQSDGIGPRFCTIPPNNLELSLELKGSDGTNNGTYLKLRARRNTRNGEIGYFVVNEQQNLFINDRLIASNPAAGPLPEFAVIQVGFTVVFWWRSRAAMGYVPETMLQCEKAVEEEDATKEPSLSRSGAKKTVEKGADADEEPMLPLVSGSEEGEISEVSTRVPKRLPTRPLTSWKEILDSGLRRHHEQRIAAGDKDGYHQIEPPSGMDIVDVLFAVATFWEPLRNRGTNFAFAGADIIDQNLQQQVSAGHLESFGVVGKRDVFIMPLVFPLIGKDVGEDFEKPPESKEFSLKNLENVLESNANAPTMRGGAKKDNIETDAPRSSSSFGHLLLAVVKKDPDSHNVNIDILDSQATKVDRAIARIRATEVASIWLKAEVQAEPHFKSVPQQPRESNACGLYVILNAWAIMLDIRPISFHSDLNSRPGGCGTEEFVKDGLTIVNSALAACMDSMTVRAFLFHYGYTKKVVRNPPKEEDDSENSVLAVGMNQKLFHRALEQAKGHSPDSIERIQVQSPSPLSAVSSAPGNGTLSLQDAIPENDHGSQDALSADNSGWKDALSKFQNERLEELRRTKEQAATDSTLLQNLVKNQQVMGGAHTVDDDLQDLQDATFESAIQEFRDQAHGVTKDQAKTFLEAAGGDVEQALFLFAVDQSRLDEVETRQESL